MEQPREYYAFISYKREDEKWAKWLQDKLEHYRFPTNLNGRTDLPKNIRPTFRDVTDLKPGLLADEINNALHNSEWLIVICSPRSAKSPWVCKEAQTFIDLGRADHIIPFVIEGNPFSNDPVTECYPEALLNLTGSKELLAANINEMGRDAAAIKVVARMFNLRFDALWQRYEREKRHRRLFIIASVALFVLAVVGVAIWMFFQRQETLHANWEMMKNQARMVAEKSKEEVRKGNTYDAILALLEMITQDGSRPYVPELEEALRTAYDSLQIRPWNSRFIGEKYDDTYFSEDGNYIVGYREESIDIYESKTLRKISKISISGDNLAQLSYLSLTNDTLYVPDSLYVMCFHIPDGKLVKKEPYTEDILYKCISGCHRRIYLNNFSWVNEFKKTIDLPLDVEILDYNPKRKMLLYHLPYESGGWYNLYDCKSKKNIKTLLSYKGQFIRYLDNNITNASFSPDGNKLAVALENVGIGFVMDLNDYSTKPFDCGNENCLHFTNLLQFGRNGQLLHSSRFSNTEIYDGTSLEFVDSICYDHYKGFKDFTGNIYLIGSDVYYLNKKEISQATGGSFEWLADNKTGEIQDTLINQRYHISCNGDKLHFYDSKGEFEEWTITEDEDEALMGIFGFFSENKYMLILRISNFLWETDVIDIISGTVVSRFGLEHYGDCTFYNKKTEQLAFGTTLEDEEGRKIVSVIDFPSFDHLVSLCREATQGMILSDNARRKFYLNSK